MKTWKDSIQQLVDLGGDISENANLFVGLYETVAGEEAEGYVAPDPVTIALGARPLIEDLLTLIAERRKRWKPRRR